MEIKKRGKEKTIRDIFLRNIGEKSISDVNDWFQKSYDNEYRLYDAKEFVRKIMPYKHKKIKLVGDYDADGIGALFILIKGLKKAGFTQITYRIPTRQEGFGINTKIIEECIDEGVAIIITCDNGITGIEPINLAKEHGIAVIVTDHHEPVTENDKIILPNADLIINPKAISKSADYDGYCGAGICYKLMCELHNNNNYIKNTLQPIAAISTVADVMELREENYVIVKNGLKRLENKNFLTSGLVSLLSVLDIHKNITAKTISFKLAPCLNAAERMYAGGAKDVLNMLLFDGSMEKATIFAEKCKEINEARKEYTQSALLQAEDIILKENSNKTIPMIVYIPKIKEGLIGIISGRLAEKYKMPTIVFTDACEKGFLKGSARHYGDYNIKKNLDKVADTMIKYGGHKEAGGITLKKETLKEFSSALQKKSDEFTKVYDDTVFFDIEINASEVNDYQQEIEKYEPFGNGNPSIQVKVNNFSPLPSYGKYFKFLGKDENIVKLCSKEVNAISFNTANRFKEKENSSISIDVIGTLERQNYRGTSSIQLEFIEFLEKEKSQKTTKLAKMLKSIN